MPDEFDSDEILDEGDAPKVDPITGMPIDDEDDNDEEEEDDMGDEETE
jgi:hypothetical protein